MRKVILSILFWAVVAVSISAQTTAFTYQGSLQSSGLPANGNYDFEFKLFDLVSGGAQQGSTIQRLNVAVANGIFSVSLDFGAGTLPGADRFLDIAVRTAGGGAFTPLTPRQQVNSAPYSVRSLNSTTAETATNATQLGGVAANQYVLTGDPRMTDARNPTAGSANYIQNQNAAPQASSNFNISGTGTANIFNAATQFNIGGNRILSSPGSFNIFVGKDAGQNTNNGENVFVGGEAGYANTSGDGNVYIGHFAGHQNSTGFSNTFVGTLAGFSTTVEGNTFIGYFAGSSNTTGNFNAFMGYKAGDQNTTGIANTFFGYQAGDNTTTGCCNAFFGQRTGHLNTTGVRNVFLGLAAGDTNTTGSSNTIIGDVADLGSAALTNASAIGANALVSSSNSLVLGSINGINGATSNTNVGIGTTAPLSALQIQDGGSNAAHVRIGGNVIGSEEKIITFGDWGCGGVGAPCVYIGERNADDRLEFRAGTFEFFVGTVGINVLGSGGSTALCRNVSNQISACSSSLRYKTNIGQFSSGLSFVNKLRPITFDWKDGGMKDVGFGAEDVAKIDPRFVTYNDKGEVEGVKYDRLSVAFVNAFKEQQEQIEKQQSLIEKQQDEIENLKAVVCSIKPDERLCKK